MHALSTCRFPGFVAEWNLERFRFPDMGQKVANEALGCREYEGLVFGRTILTEPPYALRLSLPA
jgi:hypothetical protein